MPECKISPTCDLTRISIVMTYKHGFFKSLCSANFYWCMLFVEIFPYGKATCPFLSLVSLIDHWLLASQLQKENKKSHNYFSLKILSGITWRIEDTTKQATNHWNLFFVVLNLRKMHFCSVFSLLNGVKWAIWNLECWVIVLPLHPWLILQDHKW